VTLPAGGEGLIRVDKPVGLTSHDVVAHARRTLGVRRVGHTGTLDPFASGLLLLCVGRATRLAEYLDAFPKSYEATARLGETTATLDPEGPVLEVRDGWEALAEEEIRTALGAFRGELRQMPPVHSAKKVRGEAAHRRVRRGEEVELEPVTVRVHEIELVEVDLPEVRFRVTCSTGTYIRAIARDLGEALGVGAHLRELRRTRIGPHGVADAVALDDLGEPGALARAWLSPAEALAHLPSMDLDEAGVVDIEAGRAVVVPEGRAAGGGLVALVSGPRLVAVGESREGRVHPSKVFPRG